VIELPDKQVTRFLEKGQDSSGAAARKASADVFLGKKLIRKLCCIKSKVFCPTFFQKSRAGGNARGFAYTVAFFWPVFQISPTKGVFLSLRYLLVVICGAAQAISTEIQDDSSRA